MMFHAFGRRPSTELAREYCMIHLCADDSCTAGHRYYNSTRIDSTNPSEMSRKLDRPEHHLAGMTKPWPLDYSVEPKTDAVHQTKTTTGDRNSNIHHVGGFFKGTLARCSGLSKFGFDSFRRGRWDRASSSSSMRHRQCNGRSTTVNARYIRPWLRK